MAETMSKLPPTTKGLRLKSGQPLETLAQEMAKKMNDTMTPLERSLAKTGSMNRSSTHLELHLLLANRYYCSVRGTVSGNKKQNWTASSANLRRLGILLLYPQFCT